MSALRVLPTQPTIFIICRKRHAQIHYLQVLRVMFLDPPLQGVKPKRLQVSISSVQASASNKVLKSHVSSKTMTPEASGGNSRVA